MTQAGKVTATQFHQVSIVVRDVEASVRRYWDLFGIGPWQIFTFEPPELSATTIDGQPATYSMKIALTTLGDFQLELIQPLAGDSIYRDFLDEHGEGVHHISLGVADYDRAMETMRGAGKTVLMGGEWRGATFSYLDTQRDLGTVVELFKTPEDFDMPAPEATYPPAD